jgi:hypothetical protein
MDREVLGVGHIDARRRQRGFEASVPGLLRLPDLADAKVRLLSEQRVELKRRWGTVGAVVERWGTSSTDQPRGLSDLLCGLAALVRHAVDVSRGSRGGYRTSSS